MKTPFLKPCPFCGMPGRMYVVSHPDGRKEYEVDCENRACEVSVCTQLHDTPQQAAYVWNRRAAP